MMGQVWGQIFSPFNKFIHKIVLVVTGEVKLFYQFTKAVNSLCTATVSTVDIKEEMTETAVRN